MSKTLLRHTLIKKAFLLKPYLYTFSLYIKNIKFFCNVCSKIGWLSPYLEQGVIESIYGAGGGLSPIDGAGDVN